MPLDPLLVAGGGGLVLGAREICCSKRCVPYCSLRYMPFCLQVLPYTQEAVAVLRERGGDHGHVDRGSDLHDLLPQPSGGETPTRPKAKLFTKHQKPLPGGWICWCWASRSYYFRLASVEVCLLGPRC